MERLFQSLRPLYDEPWFPWVVGIVGIILAYSVYKTLQSLPKLVMYPIIAATCIIVCMNWVYNRNEPAMLTPLVEMLSPWLPSRGD